MIEQSKILFTGGSGLLGNEFKKLLPNIHYPSSSEFNVLNYEQMNDYIKNLDINLLIHAAAFTSPPRIDKDPVKAIDVNIIGTSNVVKLCKKNSIKLIYLSTDYVFKGDKGNYKEEDAVLPINKYAWSKLGGECAVRLYDNSIIIRTSFGPNEFPFPKAFIDQWTSRESVKQIAKKIAALLRVEFIGIVHIGGKRKTVFEFAKELDKDKEILELKRNEVDFNVPTDTSLDCSKYNKLMEEIK
ncbi:MAG: SDR family oxidoreductase [Promethearchaeota archaeon]